MVWRMKNFNILGIRWKIRFLGGGGGTWTVCWFKGGGVGKKEVGGVFEGGSDTQCTLWVCEFVLSSLLFHYWESRTWSLSSVCKTVQADYPDWISFLSSNLMEEISPNIDTLSANTYSLSSAWKRWKDNE